MNAVTTLRLHLNLAHPVQAVIRRHQGFASKIIMGGVCQGLYHADGLDDTAIQDECSMDHIAICGGPAQLDRRGQDQAAVRLLYVFGKESSYEE